MGRPPSSQSRRSTRPTALPAEAAPEGAREAPKRSRILAAAARVFLHDGFRASSMDRVTAAAGVSKATVYAHFRSKESLFAAVVENLRKRIALPDAALEQDHDPALALGRYGRSHLAVIGSGPVLSLMRMILAESARVPEMSRAFYRAGPGEIILRLAAYLRQQDAAGRLRVPDPEQAAEQFLGMVVGITQMRRLLALPDESAIDRRIDEAVNTFMARYGPTPC